MADNSVDFGILAGAGAPLRSYKAGEVIFREGDPAMELFIVKSGKVNIQLGNRLLDTLPELSIFGEMALIDPAPPQRNRGSGDGRDNRSGRREAVSFSGQPHAAFRAQRDARAHAPAANIEHRGLLGRSSPRAAAASWPISLDPAVVA